MNSWLHCDGELHGVAQSLLREPTPDGAATWCRLTDGSWWWYAHLRDRGEEDVPAIRDWFGQLCGKYQPSSADLLIDVDGLYRYSFSRSPECQDLEMDVPPLVAHRIMRPINVICDGGAVFLGVQTDDGEAVPGQWAERGDGTWALRITELP
jgi:hypothetical protein